MIFYYVDVKTKNNPYDCFATREQERLSNTEICKATMDFYEKDCFGQGIIFVCDTSPLKCVACVKDDKIKVEHMAKELMDKLGVSFSVLTVNETSVDTFFSELSSAGKRGTVDYADSVVGSLGLDLLYCLGRHASQLYSDKVVGEKKTAKQLNKDVSEYFLGGQYKAELGRILKGKTQTKFIGHPAHYIIVSKNGERRRVMIRDIISALYKKGRLLSKRYTILAPFDNVGNIGIGLVEYIYKLNVGSTVLIKINSAKIEDDGFKRSLLNIDDICAVVKEHCSKVLTIFSIDSALEKIKNKIMNSLYGVTVVDISEDVYQKDSALSIIENFAKKDDLLLSEEITDKIKNSDRTYDYNDLLGFYNKLRHEYLGTQVFSEYKKYVTHEVEKPECVESDAYTELMEMIGLDSVKKTIDDVINYFKMQKEYRLRGIVFSRPAMHMVFTGSPGTAKTSVARLVARILKDNGVLSVGNLVEVGRGDIVGQYVGSTAPLIKSFFERATGSVLFIDEAYSLVDEKKGLYGDEAINTIVQEMENQREDLVVIFAGYQNEMERFLNRNPGLNSRIAFNVAFDDYSCKELLDITNLLAHKMGFLLIVGLKINCLRFLKMQKKTSRSATAGLPASYLKRQK